MNKIVILVISMVFAGKSFGAESKTYNNLTLTGATLYQLLVEDKESENNKLRLCGTFGVFSSYLQLIVKDPNSNLNNFEKRNLEGVIKAKSGLEEYCNSTGTREKAVSSINNVLSAFSWD